MEIHLIRHGKTLANEQRKYCGATDLPLSETGKSEIIMLKNQGVYPPACMFFTSGLLRTVQTLKLIYGNVKSTVISNIVEFNFGIFEMKCYEDLKENDDYKAWITDLTGDIKCPNGDSRNLFKLRVMDGFGKIINMVETSAAVICHGGVIVSIMESLFPGERNFYEWQPEPGRGYTLTSADASEGLKIYKKI